MGDIVEVNTLDGVQQLQIPAGIQQDKILQIKGANLHMSRLTLEKAEIDIDGEIASLVYSSADHYNKPGESFWKRVFR